MDQLDVQTKIGLVVVSASSISELRYPRAAPPGVAFLTSRMMLEGGDGIDALIKMEGHASRAVGELVSAKVDSVAYCCTVSGALRGMEGDRQFCRELEDQWGTPITSTMLAVVEALQHMDMKKIVVTTPYPDSHHVAERAYLKEAGIEALTMQGMGLESAEGFASVRPQEIFDFARDAWKEYGDEADGLFISCMNHDGMAVAQTPAAGTAPRQPHGLPGAAVPPAAASRRRLPQGRPRGASERAGLGGPAPQPKTQRPMA